ncbi:hypothetical protein EV139_0272 [Leucobacter luti]|uniref:Uncharacterized protein n=1 Tax=Leucobacter luti TaxID=340320 RepID=A0A4Q7U615_9MICO|nr:hypothetical protein EV139_0272 [Leucobacter luti]
MGGPAGGAAVGRLGAKQPHHGCGRVQPATPIASPPHSPTACPRSAPLSHIRPAPTPSTTHAAGRMWGNGSEMREWRRGGRSREHRAGHGRVGGGERRGAAGRGGARRGAAGRGAARPGAAERSAAQRGAARHAPAQLPGAARRPTTSALLRSRRRTAAQAPTDSARPRARTLGASAAPRWVRTLHGDQSQRLGSMSLMMWRMVPECERITMLSARTNGPRRCTPSMNSASVMPVATK